MAPPEPFPILNSSVEQLHSGADHGNARRRRKSSVLGADIRVGDTGAPSLQSSLESFQETHGHAQKPSTPDGKEVSKRGSKRRKARSFLRRCKHFALKHTWVLPLVLLAVFLSLYAINPTESNPIHHFIFLSYKLPLEDGADPDTPPQYGKGPWDVALVAFYTVVLSFTREFIMQELLRPLARKAGLKSRAKQARFLEQMYTAVYFAFLGPAGMYVMSRTPVWYFNTRGMYENFPHKTHEAAFKFYYLFQAAYWAQQAIVLLLGMEKPRKDYKELVGHHIVSLMLIGLSYRFHFTYIGLAVYITHDISDFFLATSKTLNYIDHPLVGPYFFIFMTSWAYLRHYLNLRIIYSLFTEFRTVGPYELNWETEQYKCQLSFVITLVLLSSLQALNLFWFFFIVRIAYRFIVYQEADDDRSEAEESDVEEQENTTAEKPKAIKQSTEAVPLLNGNANGNGIANGVKTRSNGAASASKKKASR
ncbi:longevity assurance proteins LAG1/LAC1 [Daldinia caldariorum]|uniref:longevity assurance proteins LAG1/LAC1 n=1 Tax=Daldinia caldariorum TaxID=326644 RepID=UPI0020081A3C|nr:longevity assurance proteins LAG1/LAC1 [Daldinia caldariorum]KAI1464782.1 longevity assurance proteins LAG1/LAC1 [Daldinia caldariorum]